jgi:hypothetical protein
MRLNATFRCSLATNKTAHPVGEELATYLSFKLTEGGIPISNIDNFNDIGWALDTTVLGKDLFLAVAYLGKGDIEWLLQINGYATRFWDTFRRNVALPEREQLAPLVHLVLSSDPHFSKIYWHRGDPWKGGHATTPDGAECEP